MRNQLLATLANSIDNFTLITGKIISWFTLFMVLITFLIVVLRYGFNIGWIAMQESVLYMHGLVFLLGAAYTLKEGSHVRIDVFYQKYSIKTKALVDLLGTFFLLIPVCVFIFYISFNYVSVSWRIMETSAQPGGLPFVYISKTFLLIFSITLILQGFSEIIKNSLIYLYGESEILLKTNTALATENMINTTVITNTAIKSTK